MRGRFWVLAALFLGVAAIVPGVAQVSVPGPAQESPGNVGASLERVIGEVTATDPAGKQLVVRMDAGGTATVILRDTTIYLRVPPGETDLKKAVAITPADIGVGDRVYARGQLAEDHKSIPAVAVIVMTKADLAQKRERDRAEWQKRAVAGIVTALRPDTREITVSVRSREGSRSVVVEPSENTVFRRYAADSVQFGQAQSSSFAALKVGDSLRILAEKTSDGTRIRPEEIVSGSFRNIPGIINSIDAGGGEIRMTDLQTKKPLTVRITSETLVRRLAPAKPAVSTSRPPQGGRGTATPPSRPQEGGRGVPPMDLERMPALKLGELKQGEAILVLCTVGAEPSRVTAIVMVAGIEPLLGQTPEGPPQIGGAWDFFDINLP